MMMIMTMITITVKSEPMSTVKNPVSLFKKIQEKKKKKKNDVSNDFAIR